MSDGGVDRRDDDALNDLLEDLIDPAQSMAPWSSAVTGRRTVPRVRPRVRRPDGRESRPPRLHRRALHDARRRPPSPLPPHHRRRRRLGVTLRHVDANSNIGDTIQRTRPHVPIHVQQLHQRHPNPGAPGIRRSTLSRASDNARLGRDRGILEVPLPRLPGSAPPRLTCRPARQIDGSGLSFAGCRTGASSLTVAEAEPSPGARSNRHSPPGRHNDRWMVTYWRALLSHYPSPVRAGAAIEGLLSCEPGTVAKQRYR